METFELRPCPPYDFQKSMLRLRHVGHEMYRFKGNTAYRTIRVNGKVYLIEMVSLGTAEEPRLRIGVLPAVKGSELKAVMEAVSRMLSIDLDLNAFYRHIHPDPVLSPAVQRFYGLRLILEADPFECLIKTIIGQQLNLAFAARLTRRLVHFASPPFLLGNEFYPVFPTPERLASIAPETLQMLQFSRRKAEYVIGVARKVATGELDFRDLETMEDEQIIEKLCSIRGVGKWTAECFLLFGMGRTNLLPAADVGLRNAVKANYRLGKQPDEEYVRKLGQSWSPWSSYATLYLWETLMEKT